MQVRIGALHMLRSSAHEPPKNHYLTTKCYILHGSALLRPLLLSPFSRLSVTRLLELNLLLLETWRSRLRAAAEHRYHRIFH